jgi:hypothetical protein
MSVFPPPSPSNPPGQRQLAYRRATYAQLQEWMELLVSLPTIPGIPAQPNDFGVPVLEPNVLKPLPYDHNGFLQALLDAWAVVGDVLTFYQERIANEGFLGTALRSYSVRELMSTIDHVPLPALSASTTFAFVVKPTATTPLLIPIPKGTAIGAAPSASGTPPPTFETSQPLDARVEWNAIAAIVQQSRSDGLQDPAVPEAPLAGPGVAALKPGSPITITGNADGTGSTPVVLTSTIRSVDVDRTSSVATVTWDPIVPAPAAPIKAPQFTVFRGTAGLFGAGAPAWSSLPDGKKATYATRAGGVAERTGVMPAPWSTLVYGNDGQNVLALAYDAAGALYSLTAQHLQCWDGSAWRALLTDQRAGLLSLAIAGTALYVGTARGDVRVSRDGGTTWSDVGPPLPTMPPAAGPTAPVQMTRLPAAAVRSLAVWSAPGNAPLIVAGTDRGLAAAFDNGTPWSYCNTGLDVVDPAAAGGGAASVSIAALSVGPAQSQLPISVLAVTSSPTGTKVSSNGTTTTTGPSTLGLVTLDLTTKPGQTPIITAAWTMVKVDPSATVQPQFSSVAWAASHAYAAGPGGLWTTPDPTPPPTAQPASPPAWTQCTIPDDAQPSLVATDVTGDYVVVSAPSGVASSPLAGATGTWNVGELPWSTGPAAAIAVGQPANVVNTAVALPLGAFPAEWPNFEVSGTTIDLERMVPTLAAGGNLLLVDDSGPALTAFGTITQVQTVRAAAYAQTALVTRLTVTWSKIAGGPALALPRRTTRAYFDSRTLRLAPPPAGASTAAPATAPTPSRPQAAAAPSRRLTTVQAAQRAQLKRTAPSGPQLTPVQGRSLEIDGAPALLPASRPVIVSGKPIRARIVGAAGGVGAVGAASPTSGARFSPVGHGENFDCTALVRIPPQGPQGTGAGADATELLVATTQGVWRLTAGAKHPWTYVPLGGVQPNAQGWLSIHALTLAGTTVVAATDCGVVQVPLDVQQTTTLPIAAPAAGAPPDTSATIRGVAYDGTTLWAGGDDGLWRWDDVAQKWLPVTEPGAPTQVTMLRFVPAFGKREAMLVAGTPAGLALRTAGGWRLRARGLTNTEVVSAAAVGEHWFCGTRGGGLFRCKVAENAGGTSSVWEHVPLTRLDMGEDVPALAADETTGALYGSLRGVGAFRIDTTDARLRPAFYEAGIANDVRDLVLAGSTLFAASRSGTVLVPQPNAVSMRTLCTIFDTSSAAALDDGQVDPALRLSLSDCGVVLPATVVVQPIEPKMRWLIVVDGVDDLLLRLAPEPGNATALLVSQIVSYPVFAAPDLSSEPRASTGKNAPLGSVTQPWTFTLADGAHGTFRAFPGQVQCAPAVAADGDVAERAEVSSTVARTEKGTSLLTLSAPLLGVYDAATVTVLGNVVDGTHGQTGSTYEVIGSGDASKAGQSFPLARKGITMLPTGPSGEQQPQITVKVRTSRPRSAIGAAGSLRQPDTTADGAVTWTYADEVLAAPPAARVYGVEQDDSGTATVMFGDGTHGRRLPTGSENVIAQYRVGSGPSGNLPPGAISRLSSKPPGVSGVTNPVAAQGGTAAADPAATRGHARDGLTSLQRVISFADVADYALAYGGFAKAHLRVPLAPKRKAYLTLAGTAGAEPDATLVKELLDAIRLDGGGALPIVARAYRPRAIRIGATLYVDGDLDPGPVETAARSALEAQFAFESRRLCEPVYAAEIVALLQSVAGVDAVELTALGELAWTAHVVDVLPGYDEWSATDGELLYRLAQDDVHLTIVTLP